MSEIHPTVTPQTYPPATKANESSVENHIRLARMDTYTQCYDRLRPHIAFMLHFLRINKSWVPQEDVKTFDEIFQEWLTNVEKKGTGGKWKEFASGKGHMEVTALFARLKALRQTLESDPRSNPPPTAGSSANGGQ